MERMLPPIKENTRILIICEGYEEYDYLVRLKSCKVWSNEFGVDIKNAKSIDNVAATYEYYYSNGNYKLVVVFCDTEKYPYEQFLLLKQKINDFHDNKSADSITFFANPCTMQIILSHFDKVSLKLNEKSYNAELIKKFTGVSDYRAMENQRSAIMKKINAENYQTMKNNIVALDKPYLNVPSTNAIRLFNALENGNENWVNSINIEIDK